MINESPFLSLFLISIFDQPLNYMFYYVNFVFLRPSSHKLFLVLSQVEQ